MVNKPRQVRDRSYANGSKKEHTILPDRPDALVRAALTALDETERRCGESYPEYLYRRLKQPDILSTVVVYTIFIVTKEKNVLLGDVPGNKRKLDALCAFTFGHVWEGLSYLHMQRKETCPHIYTVPSYFEDRDMFKKEMRHLACILQGSVYGVPSIET